MNKKEQTIVYRKEQTYFKQKRKRNGDKGHMRGSQMFLG